MRARACVTLVQVQLMAVRAGDAPVLILTGHFCWHMPSAAHVASPSYSYAFSNVASRALTSAPASSPRPRRREISLYAAMRWRGVSVRSRLGQLLSQKPHSMQRSTIGDAVGDGLKNLR